MDAIATLGIPTGSVRKSRGQRAARLVGALWCTALLWFLLATVAPAIVGWRPMVVTTGSMSPAVRVGSVVVVEPSGGHDVALHDVVVYERGGRMITHRVVGLRSDDTIQTQGDANDRPDSDPVRLSQVRGEVRFVVPAVGLPILWLHEGRILPLGILMLLTLLALAELPGPVPRRHRGAHFAEDPAAERRAAVAAKVRMAAAIGIVGAIVAGLSVPPVEAAFTSATTNDGSTLTSATSFGIRYRGLIGTASCGTPTLTITVASAISVGRTVIVQVGLREGTAGATVTASDSRSNTYTTDADLAGSKTRTIVFSAYVATALQIGDTISVAVPTAKVQAVMASQFSGIAPSNRVDTSGTGTANNTTPSASVTTTWTDTLLYAALTNRNNNTWSEVANYLTVAHQALNCSTQLGDNHGAYRVVSGTGTYSYAPSGFLSTDWTEVLIAYKAADNVAPSAPTLSGTAGDQETNLSWTAVTDISSPVTYQVFRDGVQIYSGTATSYNDTTVSNSTTYAYTVRASDSYSNQSANSNEVDLTPMTDASIRYRRLVGTASCGGATDVVSVPVDGIVAGRVLVVRVVLANTFAAGTISATDSKGNTYSLDKDTQSSTKARVAYLSAYVTTPLVNGDTITVTHPDSGVEYVAVNEVSGVAATNRVGVSNGATASTTSPSASLTTLTSKTIIFAGIATAANSTFSTTTAGWTQLAGVTGPLCTKAFSTNGAYQIVQSAGAYTYGATIASTEWDEAIVAYKAADSTAPAAPTLSGVNGDGEEFLSWTAVTDPSAPVTYQLYRDGLQIYTGTALKYDDLSRTNGVTYAYTVYATDSVGNVSVVSNTYSGKPVSGASAKLVQSIGSATCGSTSSVVTVPAAGVAEGHTVVLRLSMHGAVAGTVSATDGKGNTYTNDADVGTGDRAVVLSGYVNSALVTGDTITVTHPTNTSSALSAADFSGIAPSSRVDATGTATGSSNAPSVAITAVSSRTVVVTGTAIAASVTYTEASGWTQQAHQTSTCGSTAMGHTAYKKLYDAGANTYTAALGGSKAWSAVAVAYKAAGEDVTGPTAPTLSGTAWHLRDSLSWTQVHDFSAPLTYHLTRNGVEVYSGSALSYDDTSVVVGTTYNYVVYATDAVGNAGTNSATVSLVAMQDTVAPSAPSGLAVLVGTSGNIVSWSSVTDPTAPVTYQLYRGVTLVYNGSNLTYTDTTGIVGSIYTVKASDGVPNQSVASSPVTAVAGIVSSAVIQKQQGGFTTGYLRQGGGYYIYANVSVGSQTVTANVSNVTTGATSVSLTAGSYTAAGVSYNYRSALQTANGTLAEGAKSFTVTPYGGVAYNGSVTIDNTGPTAVDIQAVDVAGTLGKMETGDTVTYTFSEPPSSTSIIAGWDGTSTAVRLVVTDAAGSDSWVIKSSDGATTLPLGTVNCNDPVASGGATWNATMVASGDTVTVTLTTMISGSLRISPTKTTPIDWTPSATVTDRAGNAMSTALATESGAVDADF